MQQALEVDAAVIGTGQAAASLAIALARRGEQVALGDINQRGAFTHTSCQDHRIVLANHGVLQDALPIPPTVGEFLPFVLGKLRPLQ